VSAYYKHAQSLARVVFLVYILIFAYAVSIVPLSLTVIITTAQSLLAVEGLIVALLSLLLRRERRPLLLLAAFASVIFSLITIMFVTSEQSLGIIQVTTGMDQLFLLDVSAFVFMLWLYFDALIGATITRD
jgi:hypothetical protein